MKSTKVSYSFGSIDTKVPKVPSSNYESVPHSIDFIPPTPGLGFLRDVGGVVYGKLTYQHPYNITNPLDLPYKGWVEGYVSNLLTDLTTGEGGLSEGVIKGLFSATPSPILTYNSSTGVFSLDSDLSKYSNTPGFITLTNFNSLFGDKISSQDITNWNEAYSWGDHALRNYATESYVDSAILLATLPPHIDAITPTQISNWNIAFGYGSHEGKYKSNNYVPDWAEITNKPPFKSVATTGSYDDLTNKPTIQDFILPGDAKQVYAMDDEGEFFIWKTLTHSDLTGINSGVDKHVNASELALLQNSSNATRDGYLTAADWNIFNSKLDAFQIGNLLTWDNKGLLVVVDEVLPVDDDATDASHTLSAKKIYELLQGEEEEEEEDTTTMSYGQSFTIFIPGGADLVTKLGFTYKIPSGWTIGVVGGSSGDLEITHSLGKLPASISVFRDNGDGTKSKLEGATAYGDAKSTSTDNKLILTSYANTSLATEIRLIF